MLRGPVVGTARGNLYLLHGRGYGDDTTTLSVIPLWKNRQHYLH